MLKKLTNALELKYTGCDDRRMSVCQQADEIKDFYSNNNMLKDWTDFEIMS